MKRPSLLTVAVVVPLALLPARPSLAQTAGALENFEPTPAGDAMFGVPSPSVGGHLVLRGAAIFDFAYKPLSIQVGSTRQSIVSRQGFVHANVSLALWDRLLLSVDVPVAVLQAGDSPTIGGAQIKSPSSAQIGDVRFGARVALLGRFWDPFQIGIGGYVFVPTAPAGSYAGDGAVRGEPQLLFGGRFTHFVWSAVAGTTVRASAHPHTFNAGAGAALVLGESYFQLGPELTVAAPFTKDTSFSTPTTNITLATSTAAELLLGAKLRPLPALVIGAGAGPGLTHGWGTPILRAVGTIGYEPLPPRPTVVDTDHDGIPDEVDACPKVPGVRSEDPTRNGCPPDRDRDGIADADDACPDVAGVRSDDPKKNGCPPDRDGDGIPDAEDACPDVKGVRSSDPKKNGCPQDTDGDGIPDATDACPNVPGVPSADPKKNGCPKDTDGDGIPDAQDACPNEPGEPDADPKKNGCPKVMAPKRVLAIQTQVHFLFGKSHMDQVSEPVSDDLFTEVQEVLQQHPEISSIEVQGHTDNVGEAELNQSLSDARARAVRAWLVAKGIPADKLVAAGYGFRAPIAPNATEEGRHANRRVQFVVKTTSTPGSGRGH